MILFKLLQYGGNYGFPEKLGLRLNLILFTIGFDSLHLFVIKKNGFTVGPFENFFLFQTTSLIKVCNSQLR